MLASSVVHAASFRAHRPSLRGFPALVIYITHKPSIFLAEGTRPPFYQAHVNVAPPSGMVTHRAPILAETALIFQSSFGIL
jgi:hypothetical protein